MTTRAGDIRRALARIDVGAVERNCRSLKERVGAETELCTVGTADGYGHGAAACAAAAIRGGASRLGVAAAEEAEELRLHFPEVPILVMGPERHRAADGNRRRG